MSTANCRCTAAQSGASSPDQLKQPPCPCKKCKTKAVELKRELKHPCKKPEDFGSEADARAPAIGSGKCACAGAKSNGLPDTGQGMKPDNNGGYWREPRKQRTEDNYWPDDRQDIVYAEDVVNYWPDYPEEKAYQERQKDYWPKYDDNNMYPVSRWEKTGNIEENKDYWPKMGQQAYDNYTGDIGKNSANRDYYRRPSNLNCECAGTNGRDFGLGPEYSNNTNDVIFGLSEYGRKSSLTEGTPSASIDELPPLPRSACSINYVPGSFEGIKSGRDTLGVPIHLRGKQGLLNISNMICQENSRCNEYCGITNCSPACAKRGKVVQGIQLSSNENINAVITFLLEILGILVFFAICTFTFWIMVCYYVIQLLINLINADRNVHVTVGIMFTLLIIAYSITHLTYGAASCGQRNQNYIKAVRVSGGCSCHGSAGDASSTRAALSSVKKSLANIFVKPKCRQANAIHPGKSSGQRHGKASKPKYTDCQGRKIFQNSRRNAMITEMKQPPMWILWLRETISGLLAQS